MDRGGFEAFCAASGPTLLRQLVALTAARAEAEDCLQGAYARAWQRWSRVSTYDDPAAWVATVKARLSRGRQALAQQLHLRTPVPDDDLTRLLAAYSPALEIDDLPPLEGIAARGRQRARRRTALLGSTAAIAVVAAGALALTSVGGADAKPATIVPVATPGASASPDASPAPSPSPANPPLAHGQQGTRAQVPWDQVGPGWTLATWSADGATKPVDLFLLDPPGGRYLIKEWAPSSTHGSPSAMSGDGRHALLLQQSFNGTTNVTTAAQVMDLTTAAITTAPVGTIGFTQPTGQGLIVHSAAGITRTGLDGSSPVVLDASATGAFEAPDGKTLVTEGPDGLRVIDNSGHVQRTLAGPHADCAPNRWVGATRLEVVCAATDAGQRIWALDTTGQGPDLLLARTPAVLGADEVDGLSGADVFSGQVFTDTDGACGHVFVGRAGPDGTVTKQAVPASFVGNQTIAGDDGVSRLLVRTEISCGGPGAVYPTGLLWLDPATGKADPLLGPGINGGSASGGLVIPGPASDSALPSRPSTPAALDLHSVDWGSVTLPADVCDTATAVALTGGRAVVATPEGLLRTAHTTTVVLTAAPPLFGTLGHTPVAAVHASCFAGRPAMNDELQDTWVLFTGDEGVVSVRETLPTREHGGGDLGTYFGATGARFTGRSFSVPELAYAPGDSHACPSIRATTTWTLTDGGELTPTTRVTGHLSCGG